MRTYAHKRNVCGEKKTPGAQWMGSIDGDFVWARNDDIAVEKTDMQSNASGIGIFVSALRAGGT